MVRGSSESPWRGWVIVSLVLTVVFPCQERNCPSPPNSHVEDRDWEVITINEVLEVKPLWWKQFLSQEQCQRHLLLYIEKIASTNIQRCINFSEKTWKKSLPRMRYQWETKGMVPSNFSLMKHWFQLRLLIGTWVIYNSTGNLWGGYTLKRNLLTLWLMSLLLCLLMSYFVSLCSISHELVVSCLVFYTDHPYIHDEVLWKPVDSNSLSYFKIPMTRACLEVCVPQGRS